MTPSFRWSEWECCSPGYISDMLCWQKSRLPYKKKFGSKKHTFAPSAQLEPHRSMFSTRKRCIIGIPIRGYQNFYSLPPKNWIWGPKTAKFGPKLAFWAKYRHFWPTWSNAWPKNNADKLPKWFSVMLVPKLLLNHIKIRLFGLKMAKDEMKWPKMVQNKGEIINLEYARENIEKPNVWIGTMSCF